MEAASTLLSTSKPSGADGEMGRGGLYCYLATPFNAGGDVDKGQLAEYVSEMLTFDLAGLTCMASTCEGPYLTDAEWRLVLETVGKIAGGQSLLNVGVGAYSTRQSLENAKRAKDAGATSLMIEMSQFYPVQFEDVFRHYATIAEQVDRPIRLYNLTLPTRFDFTSDRLRKMAEISRIDSVKEASGEVSRLEDIRINRRFTFDVIHRELGVLCLQRLPRVAPSRASPLSQTESRMPQIGTSGLMGGDGKRGDGQRPPSCRAHPLLYPERTSGLSSATDRAGDALGQCEIPLGPKNWLFRLNRQRGVQLGHSSYKFTAVAASDPPQS